MISKPSLKALAIAFALAGVAGAALGTPSFAARAAVPRVAVDANTSRVHSICRVADKRTLQQ